MPRTVRELLEAVGGDAQETVATASKRWREQVRRCILSLTGLKLTRQQDQNTEQLNVHIRIDPGLPEPLRAVEDQEFPSNDKWAIELIGLSGHDVERLLTACKNLSPLIQRLRDIPGWGHRAETYDGVLAQTETTALELAEYAAKAELLELIFQINRDVLGRYRPAPGDLWPSGGQIELYWLIIGATARLVGAEVEGLTITVLAHEMAHAYTHLGMDLDGVWWEDGFWQCDIAVVEGLAQYYTHKTLETPHAAAGKPERMERISGNTGPAAETRKYALHKPYRMD